MSGENRSDWMLWPEPVVVEDLGGDKSRVGMHYRVIGTGDRIIGLFSNEDDANRFASLENLRIRRVAMQSISATAAVAMHDMEEANTRLFQAVSKTAERTLLSFNDVVTEVERFLATPLPSLSSQGRAISFVIDGPPAHHSGRFVELEDEHGHGIRLGEWHRVEGSDMWSLRIDINELRRYLST